LVPSGENTSGSRWSARFSTASARYLFRHHEILARLIAHRRRQQAK
jgi:hypothetical protein